MNQDILSPEDNLLYFEHPMHCPFVPPSGQNVKIVHSCNLTQAELSAQHSPANNLPLKGKEYHNN